MSILTRIREIADEEPDYVYIKHHSLCVYTKNGEGCCIVGKAILKEKPELYNYLNKLDCSENGAPYVCSHSLLKILIDDFSLTDKNIFWISRVQEYQDRGMSWSQCIVGADLLTDFFDRMAMLVWNIDYVKKSIQNYRILNENI